MPLVARWPGKISAGRVSDLIGAFWDVLPTVASITGAKIPEGVDGVSLAPTLFGSGEQKQHEYLYWEFPAYGGQQAVRMGDWKGVRQDMLRKGNKQPLKIELYNLAKTPDESEDVAAAHSEIVEKMAAIMAAARTPSEIFPFPTLDNP